MNIHFPHSEPIVVREHELRAIRRFPSESEIAVRVNDRVPADRVLGKSDPHSIAVRIPVADQLDIAPGHVTRYLMRPIGSTFAAGEPLARMRRGVRNVVAATPVAGTLVDVEQDTGVALVAPVGAGELRALIPGDVEAITKTSVTIRTVGARLLGVIGIGNAVAGPLRLAVEHPDQELTVERVTPELAGAIVAGGSHAGSAAIRKLVEVGAVGLVTGGLVEREVAAALSWKAEDRLAPWRPLPGNRAIAEGLPVPIALVATEGFGPLPMNPKAFDLLRECAGQRAILLAGTRVVGSMSRPELIVPDEEALDRDGQTSRAMLAPGVSVRLVDQANLGKLGVVASEPRRERFGDGNVGLVVDVDLTNGSRRAVRVENLEIMN